MALAGGFEVLLYKTDARHVAYDACSAHVYLARTVNVLYTYSTRTVHVTVHVKSPVFCTVHVKQQTKGFGIQFSFFDLTCTVPTTGNLAFTVTCTVQTTQHAPTTLCRSKYRPVFTV